MTDFHMPSSWYEPPEATPLMDEDGHTIPCPAPVLQGLLWTECGEICWVENPSGVPVCEDHSDWEADDDDEG